MVGMGLIMVALSWLGILLLWGGRLERARWFLWAALLSFSDGLYRRARWTGHVG
jgi:cytochrome bd ubiquinol oxidase subunit I